MALLFGIFSATLVVAIASGASVDLKATDDDLQSMCTMPGYSDGNYQHPTNCSKFIQCNNGATIVIDCPPDKVFNEVERLCDSLDNVPRCQPPTTTPAPTTPNPTTTPFTYAPPPSIIYPPVLSDTCSFNHLVDGSYKHPTSCTLYLQCNDGITSVLTCPGSLVFNEIRRLCDTVDNVPRCQPSTLPPKTTMAATTFDPNDLLNRCRLPGYTDGVYPHPDDCHSYIQCEGGYTSIRTCKSNLVFNDVSKFCDLVIHVPRCQEHGVGPTLGPNGYSTYCSDFNLASGIHPDPWSCVHFIECTFGRTDHMPCPPGLAFDVNILTCAEKASVNCQSWQ